MSDRQIQSNENRSNGTQKPRRRNDSKTIFKTYLKLSKEKQKEFLDFVIEFSVHTNSYTSVYKLLNSCRPPLYVLAISRAIIRHYGNKE